MQRFSVAGRSTEQFGRNRYTVPQILIVEDDSRSRRTLHLALAAHGYQVSDAADGKQALDVFAARAPELIVLDWHLPEFDGIQTCRSLRAVSAVPILMVSGNRLNTRAVALEAGATDYLPKPFSVDELLAMIQSALQP